MARFDCATWKPVVNHGGAMARNMGLLLHHAVANGSLYNWFNNPSSQVSAHFWVSKSGLVEQYVDSEQVAWHAMQMNDTYCGVETEGCTPSDENMTDAMVNALAEIYAEGHLRHGWPNELANADGQLGFGYHRMGVATACPCDLRLNRRQDILNKAFGSAPPQPKPPEPKPPTTTAPAFPYPSSDYLGQPSSDPHCHSGYYGGVDTTNVRTWQQRMHDRGWSIGVDGQYGPQSESICRQFQGEKHLTVDGLCGPQTWKASWEAPIT